MEPVIDKQQETFNILSFFDIHPDYDKFKLVHSSDQQKNFYFSLFHENILFSQVIVNPDKDIRIDNLNVGKKYQKKDFNFSSDGGRDLFFKMKESILFDIKKTIIQGIGIKDKNEFDGECLTVFLSIKGLDTMRSVFFTLPKNGEYAGVVAFNENENYNSKVSDFVAKQLLIKESTREIKIVENLPYTLCRLTCDQDTCCTQEVKMKESPAPASPKFR